MTPQALKASLLQRAIQGKLVEQRPEEGTAEALLTRLQKIKKVENCEFDIPDSWSLVHLESITRSVSSKSYQILESEVLPSGKIPVISQSKAYSIGFTDSADKVYQHDNPVIVFGDHTTEVKYVDFDFVVGADGVKIFEPLDGVVLAKYLYYVFLFNAKDLRNVGGYSRHYKFIKNQTIPLPPLAEQKRIVERLEQLLALTQQLC